MVSAYRKQNVRTRLLTIYITPIIIIYQKFIFYFEGIGKLKTIKRLLNLKPDS